MKKGLFILLAVIMAVFCAANAFAQTETETEAVPEVKWADMESIYGDKLDEGEFYSVSDLGLKMWIPSMLTEQELTDEEIEAGDISYLTNEDQTVAVNISYTDMEGATLDDMVAYFSQEEGYSDVQKVILNGIEAVSLEDTVNDVMLAGIMTDKGYLIQFMFFPRSNEEFRQVASIMATSIQPEE